jgi:triosephosphate isomerase
VRKIVIAGNWKMHKTQGDALAFLQEFLNYLTETPGDREAVLCVPFTALSTLSKNLHGSLIKLGAQNIHWADEGAFTGKSPAIC